MIDGFGGGVEAAVDAVAAHAFFRGTGELATDVATLTRHEVMATTEFKSGSGVIEGFFLGQDSAGVPHQ